MRIAIVGAGYMGSIHAKTIHRIQEENPGLASLEYIVDLDLARAKKLANLYNARYTSGITDLTGNIDLAIVATPTHTHRIIIEKLHDAGITGMLVEKPLAASLSDAVAIVKIAGDVWLSAGHSERFNPAMDAFAMAYRLLAGDSTLLSVETRRVGPFVERARSVDVVHDLATHDFDIILAIVGEMPRSVYAAVRQGIVSSLPDHAHIVMEFDGAVAETTVSRVSPVKERRARAAYNSTTGHAAIELDFIAQSATLYTQDRIESPPASIEPPIYREDLEVIKSFATGMEPPVSVYESFTVLQACDMALKSGYESRPVALSEYSSYENIVEEGIDRYRRFKKILLQKVNII